MVPIVEAAYISPTETLHHSRNTSSLFARNQEVNMICHQYVCVDGTGVYCRRLLKRRKIEFVIKIIAKANRTVYATLDNMLGNAGNVNSRCPGHPWLS